MTNEAISNATISAAAERTFNNRKFFTQEAAVKARHYIISNNSERVAFMYQENNGRRSIEPVILNAGNLSETAMLMSAVVEIINRLQDEKYTGLVQIHVKSDLAIRYRALLKAFKQNDDLFDALSQDWMTDIELRALMDLIEALTEYDREKMAIIINDKKELKYIDYTLPEGIELTEGAIITVDNGICNEVPELNVRAKAGRFTVRKYMDKLNLERDLDQSKFYSLMVRMDNLLSRCTPRYNELDSILAKYENMSDEDLLASAELGNKVAAVA